MWAAALVGGLLLSARVDAAPGDRVFTVGNYPVEAHAGDAVSAKSRAIADGQKAALRSLIKKLVPVTAYARIRKLQVPSAANLVESYSVRTERNSSTAYIASLDFRFQPQSVKALLEREGIPFADTQAGVITVVPIWRAPIDSASPGAASMPTAYGPIEGPKAWTDAWNGLDLDNSLTPVKLAALKPEVHADTVKALAGGDASLWRTFAAAYGTDRLVAAIAEPDLATKKLKVTLIGSDSVGAIAWRPSYRIDLTDPNYAVELAGVVSLRVLEGRWKAVSVRVGGHGANAQSSGGAIAPAGLPGSPGLSGIGPNSTPMAGAAGHFVVVVEFRSMGEWQDISRKLSAMSGVENLDVLGMSGRSARISLRYAGGAVRLAEALAGDGIAMRQSGQGWIIAAP